MLARLLGLNVRALRILGSTALCLAWVAAGRASVCQHAQTQTARLGSVPTRGSSRQLAAARGSSRQLRAPAPPQGAPGGSAQPGRTTGHPATASAARAGRLPTNPPIPPPSSTQAFYAGLHKRDCPKQWDWCAGHAIVCAAGGVFVRHGSDAEQARPFDIDCAGGVCAGTPALAAVLQRELLAS